MDGIDTNAGISVADLRVRTAAVTPATTTPAATPVQAAVQTSAGAANANLISLLADAAPPIDSKKVEAIRSLIAQGRYPIDEHAIASKMIALDVVIPHDA